MKLQERERMASCEGTTIPPVMPPASTPDSVMNPNPSTDQSEEKQKPATFVRILFYVLSVLSPLIGWILYFVYRNKNKKLASTCCTIAFISFGIGIILNVISVFMANTY